MIDRLIQALLNLLPLFIKEISWDGDTLTIKGADWNFSTLSAWRISHEGKVQFACWDKEIDEPLKSLEGLSIVGVSPQGQHVKDDPVFELSDGRLLEIFSSDTVEPWSLQLPNGDIYIGGT